MRKIVSVLATAAFLATSPSAFAAEADFKKGDADGDGKVTLDEGKVVHSDWTEDAFKELDKTATELSPWKSMKLQCRTRKANSRHHRNSPVVETRQEILYRRQFAGGSISRTQT